MHYNVLLPETKQYLKKEYRMRFLTVVFFGVAIVGTIATISLIPSLMYVRIHKTSATVENQTLVRLKTEGSNNSVNTTIKTVKNKISLLESGSVPIVPSEIVSKILNAKTDAVSVRSILYEPKGTGHLLTVSGVAKTRNDLLLFRDAIQKVTPFEKVDFPVTVLAKNNDVPFTFSISGSF